MKKILCCLLALALAPAHAVPRSAKAKGDFAALQACPATAKNTVKCPGFIIDHKQALDCGGADAPSNMQWLTVAAAREKDKWERDGANCKHRTNVK